MTHELNEPNPTIGDEDIDENLDEDLTSSSDESVDMANSNIGQVEPFIVGKHDWTLYVERVQEYLVANGISTEEKKRAVLVTLMGSEAYELLASLVAPDKPSTKKFDDIIATMEKYLKPKPLVIAERFKFHKRSQKEGETVAQYLAELKRLAERCNFGQFLEDALRDRLVCGLRSEAIQRRLLAEEELTLKKAHDVAYSMETATKQASELHGHASTQGSADTAHFLKSTCYRCGKTGHSSNSCYFKDQNCRKCGKKGHIAKVCRSSSSVSKSKDKESKDKEKDKTTSTSKQKLNNHKMELNSQTHDTPNLEALFNVDNSTTPVITVTPTVNGIQLPMELDTGASVSLISERTWREQFQAAPLESTSVVLKTYTGQNLRVLGQLTVDVQYEQQRNSLPLLVVTGQGPPLLGRNWLAHIRLNWQQVRLSINTLSTDIDQLLDKYKDVFSPELGTLKGIYAKLTLKPNADPKIFKPRPVPYALRDAIERDLERLESLGVIEKVSYSDWAAPIVPVPKPDGSIRICGDYKVTINPLLKVDQFPVPKAEDLFSTLAGGKYFSKLDLTNAYQQVVLDPASRQYVTISTHKGLYRYHRLPFGVSSAPAIFQQTMEKILQGLPMVVVYIDDILITGRTKEEHLQNLSQVLARLSEYGLKLKKQKCYFLEDSVEYLGYVIDSNGLHATPAKVEAILNAPSPKNVTELRSFLGLVNYYGKFIKNLSTLTHSLNALLQKKVVWNWSKQCQKAFEELKSKLASTEVLAHYDPDLPIKLDCDASAYGIGAVVSHVLPDKTERPIAYASRTLTSSEKNYPQIEKEALALVYGVKKFHQFLYGRHFILVTDHKPLTAILGPKKGLPTLAAARLQRWAMFLSAYQYDLEFRTTDKHCNADGFSRLPISTPSASDDIANVCSIFNVNQVAILPVDSSQLR